MRSSAELKQELDQYKKYAKKKIDKLKGAWLHAIKYEEEHPSPEVTMQENMMAARIDKFRKHKWEPGDTLYYARNNPMENQLIVNKYKVHKLEPPMVITEGDAHLQLDRISTDELAAIALLYFKSKDMSIPDNKFHLWKDNTRYRFRRYVREWYFEVKADLEKQK